MSPVRTFGPLRGRGTLIANFAVLMVFVLGVYHVGFDVLRLQLGRQPFTVQLELASSGGLYPRSEVTYRGTLVGKVDKIRLRPSGAVAFLRLDEGTKIPVDTDAVVADLSAAGEQFVDLRPRTEAGPFLSQGSVIPVSRASTPVPTAILMRNISRLLDQVDSKDLNTVVDELALALEGTGPELGRLVDRSDYLLAGLTDALPSTVNVLRNGKVNLDTANDLAKQFASFNRSLRTLSRQLKSSDPKVRRLLDSTPAAVADLDSFLVTLTTPVYALLVSLVTPSGVITARLPALNALLVAFPDATAALASTLKKNGNLGVELHLTDNPVCEYGGPRRLPIDATRVAPNLTRICRDTSAGVGSRGAQNAPRRVPSGPQTVTLADGSRLSLGPVEGGVGQAVGMSWIGLLLSLLRS